MEKFIVSEEASKALDKLFASRTHYDCKLKINKKDKVLLKKIEHFKSECKKRNIWSFGDGNYGIHFYSWWDDRYGFLFQFDVSDPFRPEGLRKGWKTFDETFAAMKKQVTLLKKARRRLAYLIRLKNKLELPGPIIHAANGYGDYGLGDYCKEMPQEQIDEVLKY